MDERIPEQIDNEVIRYLEELKDLEPGTEEYKNVMNALERLYNLRLDYDRVDLDYRAKREKIQLDSGRNDEELRLKEMEAENALEKDQQDRKQYWIKMAVEGGIALLNIVILVSQFNKGFKFEKDGTLTSTTFKEFRQRAFGNLFRKN